MSALDAHLPFFEGGTDGYAFETFCRDLLSREPEFERVRRWGVSGDDQGGVDILAERLGERWAFQCKRERQFGAQKVRDAVSAASYAADRVVLLLARSATVAAREAAETAGWDLWDADDLSQRVRELPLDAAVPLVRAHFGDAVVRSFLGVDHDTPWVSLGDHFRPLLGADRLFTHAWDLSGRDRELADLVASATGGPWVVILPGRGGAGKSRLVLEAGRHLSQDGVAVRIVEDDRLVRPDHAEHLPAGPTLLVVDDAHRRDDLLTLARLVVNAREAGRRVRLLLSTRPHGVDALRSMLTRSGVDAPSIRTLPTLGDLDDEGLRALARAALGARGGDDALVARLVKAVGDSPLVLTVGGRLVSDGTVEPSAVGSDPAFRSTVLDRFQDEALGKVPAGVSDDHALAALRVVAAAAPLRTEAPDAVDAAAGVAGLDPVAFRQTLSALESAGVLLRRGRQLRISPDVLADHVLARAALTPDGGTTGYAERVYDALGRYAAADVLRNFAELDWRQRQDGRAPSLLDALWTRIESEFRGGGNDARLRLLQLVTESAYYMPRRVLQLCHIAARQSAADPSGARELDTYRVNHDDVLLLLPDLLRRVGFTVDLLPEVLDLLWGLAQGEGDVLRPYPDKALEVLVEIAAPSARKPLVVQRSLLDAAERWHAEQAPWLAAWGGPPEPLPDVTVAHVVAPVLRWRADANWSDGGSFYVSHAVPRAEIPEVRDIRRRALLLMEALGTDGGVPGAAVVVDVLSKRVQGPSTFESPGDPDTLQAFLSEARWSLSVVARVLRAHPDPYVADLVWRRLQWAGDRSDAGPRRRAVRRLRCRAAEVPGWPLLRALHRPNDRWTGEAVEDESDGWEAFVEGEARVRREEAQAFYDAAVPVEAAAARLAKLLDQAVALEAWVARSDVYEAPQPGLFLSALAQIDPAYGRALADRFAVMGAPFAPVVAALMAGARDGDGDEVGLLRLAAGDPPQRLAAVQAVQRRFHQESATEPDWALLRRLIADPDPDVRLAAVRLWRIGLRSGSAVARRMVTDVHPSGSPAVAEELAAGVRGLSPHPASAAEQEHVLRAIENLPSLDGHYVLSFLQGVAEDRPRVVFDLLLRRISEAESIGGAVPDVFRGSIFGGAAPEDRAELLVEAIGVAAAAEIPYDALRLAESLAHGHPAPVREVLLEMLRRRDDAPAKVAFHLVAAAPEEVPLADVGYVRALLEAARQGGGAARVDVVARRLRGAATSGSRSRSFGQPSVLDVQIRDAARQTASEVVGEPTLFRLYEQIAADASASIASDLASDEEWAG